MAYCLLCQCLTSTGFYINLFPLSSLVRKFLWFEAIPECFGVQINYVVQWHINLFCHLSCACCRCLWTSFHSFYMRVLVIGGVLMKTLHCLPSHPCNVSLPIHIGIYFGLSGCFVVVCGVPRSCVRRVQMSLTSVCDVISLYYSLSLWSNPCGILIIPSFVNTYYIL
jgi:hypothetical protein